MDSIWTFILLWGVWLITPILVDGVDAVWRLIVVQIASALAQGDEQPRGRDLPSVTVIVPAHNEAEVIDRCLTSVKAQDYPHDKLEVIVIDDGSTDDTADRVETHARRRHERDAPATLVHPRGAPSSRGSVRRPVPGHPQRPRRQGARAQHRHRGVDRRDHRQHRQRRRPGAEHGPQHRRGASCAIPKLGAATGNIEIDWDMHRGARQRRPARARRGRAACSPGS